MSLHVMLIAWLTGNEFVLKCTVTKYIYSNEAPDHLMLFQLLG